MTLNFLQPVQVSVQIERSSIQVSGIPNIALATSLGFSALEDQSIVIEGKFIKLVSASDVTNLKIASPTPAQSAELSNITDFVNTFYAGASSESIIYLVDVDVSDKENGLANPVLDLLRLIPTRDNLPEVASLAFSSADKLFNLAKADGADANPFDLLGTCRALAAGLNDRNIPIQQLVINFVLNDPASVEELVNKSGSVYESILEVQSASFLDRLYVSMDVSPNDNRGGYLVDAGVLGKISNLTRANVGQFKLNRESFPAVVGQLLNPLDTKKANTPKGVQSLTNDNINCYVNYGGSNFFGFGYLLLEPSSSQSNVDILMPYLNFLLIEDLQAQMLNLITANRIPSDVYGANNIKSHVDVVFQRFLSLGIVEPGYSITNVTQNYSSQNILINVVYTIAGVVKNITVNGTQLIFNGVDNG